MIYSPIARLISPVSVSCTAAGAFHLGAASAPAHACHLRPTTLHIFELAFQAPHAPPLQSRAVVFVYLAVVMSSRARACKQQQHQQQKQNQRRDRAFSLRLCAMKGARTPLECCARLGRRTSRRLAECRARLSPEEDDVSYDVGRNQPAPLRRWFSTRSLAYKLTEPTT